MKVLVTGALGNLARDLIPCFEKRGARVIPTASRAPDRPSADFRLMDITQAAQVREVLETEAPGLVVHLAALTDVDRCEREPKLAYQVNAKGTENLALACKSERIPLVALSTAEVFDGEKPSPYTEEDKPNPLNVYAKSKLEGEKAVQGLLREYFIVRTAWLVGGGPNDKKFVGKIMRLLATEKKIRAVSDKIGSPTFDRDLAPNLWELIQSGKFGLYHLCNLGFCSRYEMAQEMVKILGIADVQVLPASSDEFPAPAKRGKSEALENFKLNLLGLNRMHSWKDSLKKYLKEEF